MRLGLPKRLFGTLKLKLNQGIEHAIEYYKTMDANMLKESNKDFEPFISELLKYQRTTDIIRSLIQFRLLQFDSPIVLSGSSLPQLRKYAKHSILAVDMNAVEASIHLLRYSSTEKPFPYSSVTFK